MRLVLTLSAALACLPTAILAQEDAVAVRVNGEAPVVDGRLGDAVWGYAPAITDFVQRNPIEGAAPSESTSVRFAYSDRDLYVAFRGYDRDPDRVYGRLVRRDQRTSADQFSMFLDSHHDGRTAYEFSFNPSGARRDVFIFGDGAGRDDSWDPVYDWATQVDSLGWTVEMRIPFSQLRFANSDSLVFGLRLRRSVNRRNEEVNWPFFPRDQAGEVSRYGRLVGLSQLPPPKRAEALPYVAGSTEFAPAESDNPFETGRDTDLRVGGDVKLGITSGLTLDLTVNPDFGQVEADPAVVNLTAFETFFPEKRPFFIEGTDLFRFGLSPSVGGGPEGGGGGGRGQEGLVYTRRIGRRPQVDAETDEIGGYAEEIRQTTIITAGKLSGNLGKGWALGVMEALTAKEWSAVVDSAGEPGSSPVEPLSSYTVVRALRSVNRGRLNYGVIGTGTIRRLDEPDFDALHRSAFTAGFDVLGRFGRDRYEFNLAAMGSWVHGSTAAITETQERSARYFQRPDQAHATLDSTRTSLSGFSGYARLAKAVGFATWDLRFASRSPGFEANDLGFQRQADIHQQRAELELRWLDPGKVFRQAELTFEEMAWWTYGWERTRTSFQTRASGEFHNYWELDASAEAFLTQLEPRLLRGGPAFAEPSRWEFRLGGRTDFRRPVWTRLGVNYTIEQESGADSWSVNGGFRWRPPGSFSLSAEARFSWGRDDRQYITQEELPDSTYYVLGELDRREASIELRADFAITPRLSVEIYAEPFVSHGEFGVLKLAADPRAERYGDRFDPLGSDRLNRPGDGEDIEVDVDGDGNVDFSLEEPDFRVVSFRTNLVLRWEFRPGSTLFVVWQQDRGEDWPGGSLNYADALVDAVKAPGSHVFAVKLAYWFGF
ncbi:MAG: carbohydrate binding family 9 domain-containing protein [Gemmatimonadota bacterium]|nr:MAG: carbohydrate binding family 9 domain-containing protein [Gemmatimonadota bacterium]